MSEGDSEPSGRIKGIARVLAAADEWVMATVRVGVASGRAALALLQGASAAARTHAASVSDAAESLMGEVEHSCRSRVSQQLVDAPETVVAATTLATCLARGVSNGSVLGRSPAAASATALLGCFLLREELVARWGKHPLIPKRDDLTALGTAYAQKEQTAVDALMCSGHAVASSCQENCVMVQTQWRWASTAFTTGVDATIATARNALSAMFIHHPEAVVSGGTLLTCAVRGSRNGTFLGGAPRRAMATALVGCFLMRDQLAERWQPQIVAASRGYAEQLRNALGRS